jgi:hypothetical protein
VDQPPIDLGVVRRRADGRGLRSQCRDDARIQYLTAAKFRQAMVFSAPTLERKVDNLKKVGLPD